MLTSTHPKRTIDKINVCPLCATTKKYTSHYNVRRHFDKHPGGTDLNCVFKTFTNNLLENSCNHEFGTWFRKSRENVSDVVLSVLFV